MNEGFNTEVYTIVEKMPEPEVGMKAFNDYLRNNYRYPERAFRLEVEGRVYVSFIVNIDGSVVGVYVFKGLGIKECDEEVVRLIKEGPKWIPGEQNGKTVNVQKSLPVTFDLKQYKER